MMNGAGEGNCGGGGGGGEDKLDGRAGGLGDSCTGGLQQTGRAGNRG